MGDTYAEIYSDRPDKQHLIDEEAIAIMTELYHHDAIDPRDLSPVSRDVLERILSGKYTGRSQRAHGGAVRAKREAYVH
jgi:hypothetical protein